MTANTTLVLLVWSLLACACAMQVSLLEGIHWMRWAAWGELPIALVVGVRCANSDLLLRQAAGALLGVGVTWGAMSITTVQYENLDPHGIELRMWQMTLGSGAKSMPDEAEVWVCGSGAGWPLWGVGGSDGRMAEVLVPKTGFVGPLPRADGEVASGGSFQRPPHIKADRGAVFLFANWTILTLAGSLLALLVPSRWMRRLYWVSTGVGAFGVACWHYWSAQHCFWY